MREFLSFSNLGGTSTCRIRDRPRRWIGKNRRPHHQTPGRSRHQCSRRLALQRTPTSTGEDRSTLARRAEGRIAAYVTFQPDLAVAWAAEAIEALREDRQWNAVSTISCLLSGRGEDGAVNAARTALKAVGMDYTVLRATWFNQNFSEGAFLERIFARESWHCRSAMCRNPSSMPTISPTSPSTLLTDPAIATKTYELTGPARADVSRCGFRDRGGSGPGRSNMSTVSDG